MRRVLVPEAGVSNDKEASVVGAVREKEPQPEGARVRPMWDWLSNVSTFQVKGPFNGLSAWMLVYEVPYVAC
jgi:hypothetical protein